jgi:hypothetical protein
VSRNLTVISITLLVIISIAILGGMVWANTLYASNHPGEKEFLVPWLAARTYLEYGDNPYSEPATQRAQVVYYGHLAAEGQDPLALWLPLPLEVLYFPLAFIPDYHIALGVWMTLSELAFIAIGLLTIRLTGWQPSRLTLPVILLFPALSVFGFFGLVAGSGTIFVGLSFVGFLLALRSKQDELAGALLLLPFFSPRLLGLFPVFILWWIISQRRWRILGGLGLAFGVLLVLSFLIVPTWSLFLSDWFMPFLSNLLTHNMHIPNLSSVGIFASWSPVLGPRIGWFLAGILTFALFLEWGGVFRRDTRRFLWVSALSISAVPLLGIPVGLTGQLFLFVPLMVFLGILGERWPNPKRLGIAGLTLLITFGALWFLTIILALGWAYLALAQVLILLPPIMLLVGLYWMRWWIARPPRPGLEMTE